MVVYYYAKFEIDCEKIKFKLIADRLIAKGKDKMAWIFLLKSLLLWCSTYMSSSQVVFFSDSGAGSEGDNQ